MFLLKGYRSIMSAWKKSNRSIFENLALISQVGIMMIVPIIGGVMIGAFLDRFAKTNGVFLIICVLLGVGAAFRNLYVLSMQKSKEYDNKETPASYVQKYEKSLSQLPSKELKEKDSNGDKSENSDKL